MCSTLPIIRLLFLIICTCCSIIYSFTTQLSENFFLNLLLGVGAGASFSFLVVALEKSIKNLNFKVFNTTLLGLFLGYLFGSAVNNILYSAFDFSQISLQKETLHLTNLAVLLVCTYISMMVTARYSDEFSISLPFIKLQEKKEKTKKILTDSSVLADPRLIDLASSGLLDSQLIIPRYVLKELHLQSSSEDPYKQSKANRAIEVLKKLEALPGLAIQYTSTDFPDIKEPMDRVIKIAQFIDGNILTADISRVKQSSVESVKIINIHSLSNALKPLMQTGELINIKVQRQGKEPMQGVGYLEDGTMVVVNGAGEFIGETVKTQVLSVKHTSSGRMIFCNIHDELRSTLERNPSADQSEYVTYSK